MEHKNPKNRPTTSGPTCGGGGIASQLGNAIFQRSPGAVRKLLDQGVDPNISPGYFTPLISAVHRSDITIATMLLKAGAEVNVTELFGVRTPLEIAQELGDTAMIDLLVKFGAVARAGPPMPPKGLGRSTTTSTTRRSTTRRSTIPRATTPTSPQSLDIPLELLSLTTPPPPRHIPHELYLLIADYLPVSTLSSLSRTCHALHTLLAPRLSATFSKAPDKTVVCEMGHTRPKNPLATSRPTCGGGGIASELGNAIFQRRPEVVRKLLDQGVDPNISPGYFTPLISAVHRSDITIATMLLKAGAEVNVAELFGVRTALDIAQELGDTAMIDLLVKFGAKRIERAVARVEPPILPQGLGRSTTTSTTPTSTTPRSTTPRSTTPTSPQSLDIPIELLSLTTPPPPLRIPLELYLLIADHLPVGTLSSLSRTCHSLHTLLAPRLSALFKADSGKVIAWAIEHNRPASLERALTISGTTFEGKGMAREFGNAIFQRRSQIVRILLDHGVDPNINPGYFTPLISAVHRNDVTIATMLLEAGAEVNVTELFGVRTALGIAQQLRDTAMIDLLVKFGARRVRKTVGQVDPPIFPGRR